MTVSCVQEAPEGTSSFRIILHICTFSNFFIDNRKSAIDNHPPLCVKNPVLEQPKSETWAFQCLKPESQQHLWYKNRFVAKELKKIVVFFNTWPLVLHPNGVTNPGLYVQVKPLPQIHTIAQLVFNPKLQPPAGVVVNK